MQSLAYLRNYTRTFLPATRPCGRYFAVTRTCSKCGKYFAVTRTCVKKRGTSNFYPFQKCTGCLRR